MPPLPFTLTEDRRPKLGLIVLQADETIEDDFRRLFDPTEVRLHITRIPSGAALSPSSIREMEANLPAAAALFPAGLKFDALAYACTSGTSLIGAERVSDLIRGVIPTNAVTNPLSAAFLSLKAISAKRIGIVSPYADEIAEGLTSDFRSAGFDVRATASFGEEIEANVAKISTASITNTVRTMESSGDLDAVFLSCTNLRTLDAIAQLRGEVGLPVLSSNLVLAQDMARLAGITLKGF